MNYKILLCFVVVTVGAFLFGHYIADFSSLGKDAVQVTDTPLGVGSRCVQKTEQEREMSTLETELSETKSKLKSLQIAYDKLLSDKERELSARNERKIRAIESARQNKNIDNRVKLAVAKAHNTARELAEYLELDTKQLVLLKSALEDKSSTDVEIISSQSSYDQKSFEIEENLNRFQTNVEGFLTDTQLSNYKMFEIEKAMEFHTNRLEAKKKALIAKIPNLSENQIMHISELYENANLPPKAGLIGVYGTSYERYKHNVQDREWVQRELSDIVYNVKSILNAEQLDHF